MHTYCKEAWQLFTDTFYHLNSKNLQYSISFNIGHIVLKYWYWCSVLNIEYSVINIRALLSSSTIFSASWRVNGQLKVRVPNRLIALCPFPIFIFSSTELICATQALTPSSNFWEALSRAPFWPPSSRLISSKVFRSWSTCCLRRVTSDFAFVTVQRTWRSWSSNGWVQRQRANGCWLSIMPIICPSSTEMDKQKAYRISYRKATTGWPYSRLVTMK